MHVCMHVCMYTHRYVHGIQAQSEKNASSLMISDAIRNLCVDRMHGTFSNVQNMFETLRTVGPAAVRGAWWGPPAPYCYSY